MIGWNHDEYRESGFASRVGALARQEVSEINERIDAHLASSAYGVVAEDASTVPRAVHGLHLVDPYFRALCERPFILEAVEALLDRPVYVHQFKVNLKAARVGESWPWHQDHVFWRELDGIARADLVNVAIHLSDTDAASGPLEYFPASHRWGNLCARNVPEPAAAADGQAATWRSNVGRDLTFQVPTSTVAWLAQGCKPVAAIRSAGDVDLFHPQLVHGSRENVSGRDRRLLIITYNAVDNAPAPGHAPHRPEFLCARQCAPIRALRRESAGAAATLP